MLRNLIEFIVVITFMGLMGSVAAQEHRIKLKVNGVSDSDVYLANYYGEKLYYNDTTRADKNGNFEFKGKSGLECGKYAIVLPGPKFFDIIVAEESIHLETSVDDLIGKMKVIESAENKLFFDYLHFISDKRTAREPYDKVLADSSANEATRASARKAVEALNADVVNRQKELITNHPKALFTGFLKLTLEAEIPNPPVGVEDERLWRYMYYRNHYWDQVDFTDGRLVRDQMFHRMLDKYWTKVLPQIPDTLLKEAFALIDRTQAPDLFKYITHHITYTSEKSDIMCMDKIFVGLVNRYYRTGKVDWLNDDQMSKIIERANELRFIVCGEQVPNIILPDVTSTNWVSLYDIPAKYTIVAIWEASCGHCKKEMPKLKKLYEEWKPRGVEIFAIGNDFENEPWLKFIKEQKIGDWINVSDNPAINATDSATKLIYANITTLPSLNFRTTFDVFSTPKVFLLDAEKRIIAKQLSADQLGELLQRLEGDVVGPKADDPKPKKATDKAMRNEEDAEAPKKKGKP